jgi:hypothetical protein
MTADEVMPGDPGACRAGHGRLFRKYVAMFLAVVSLALAINGASDIWFSYQEQKASNAGRRSPLRKKSANSSTRLRQGWRGRLSFLGATTRLVNGSSMRFAYFIRCLR